MKKLGFLFLGLLLVPSLAMADIVINEIMYDLQEGSDSGREWIEIYNNGNEAIDLTNWKLYEAETNHKINLFRETDSFLLPTNSYTVIADDPNKFLIDWPDFSGVIFDSALSLNNTGETIILRNQELIDMDNVFYNSEMAANGDGNSLQKINGEWEAASPTPGTASIEGSQSSQPKPQESPGQSSSGGSGSSIYIPPEKLPKIKAYAGENKTATAGAETEFRGQALGLKDEHIDNARFLWTFGDGSLKDGKNITHIYQYPGDYIAVLNVSSGEYSASDYISIKTLPNQVFISEVKLGENGYIELQNNSTNEIDISNCQFKSKNEVFIFPASTRIKSGAYLVIPSSISKIVLAQGKNSVELYYPGGFKADIFNYDGTLNEDRSFNRTDSGSVISKETPGAKNSIFVAKPEKSLENNTVANKKITEINKGDNQQKEETQLANIITIGQNNKTKNTKIYLSIIASLVIFISALIFFVYRKSRA